MVNFKINYTNETTIYIKMETWLPRETIITLAT